MSLAKIRRAVAAALVLIGSAGSSSAATIWLVTTSGEPAALATNDCSGSSCATLRGAINASASGDTIRFDPGIDGTAISLTLYSNDLSSGSKEFGPSAFFITGSRSLTIDGVSGLSQGITVARASGAAPFRLFGVGIGSSLALQGLTLSNGYAKGGDSAVGGGALGAGGAIFNQGTLTLDRCTLSGNTARGGDSDSTAAGLGGGGVGASSPNTSYDGAGPNPGSGGGANGTAFGGAGGWGGGGGAGNNYNTAGAGGAGGFGGGGGYVWDNLGSGDGGNGGFGGGGGGCCSGASFGAPGSGGFGGGNGGPYTDPYYGSGGGGGGMGGAIFNDVGAVTIRNSTLAANIAQGGSQLQIPGVSYGSGSGGSGYGGAIFNYNGTLELDFSTVAANTVIAGTKLAAAASNGSADGGAIYSLGDGSCAAGNSCNSGTTLLMYNSIAASSTGGTNDVVLATINGGAKGSGGAGNLIGTQSGFNGTYSTGNPNLGVLANNGGLSATLAPQSGSAAIDASPNCAIGGAVVLIDQRGVGRPQGAACDIGAVEVSVPPHRCYVNGAAAGTHDGQSWGTAYLNPQSALQDFSCTEVWVAAGVYKPTAGYDRSISFAVHPGVAVYGGFAGTEAQLNERDWAANVTVLSGDIGFGISTDNSLHVVAMDGTTVLGPLMGNTVLDGITISSGNGYGDSGGGLVCYGAGAGHECSPTLSHLVFAANSADNGGAVYADGSNGGASSPAFASVTFSGNSANVDGGAVYANGSHGGVSQPSFTRVIFTGNTAATYAGAFDGDGQAGGSSAATFTDSVFDGNSAAEGGAVFNDANGGLATSTFDRAIFSGNSASDNGGAMYNNGYGLGLCEPQITNSTFIGNSAANGGGAIFNEGSYGGSYPGLSNDTFTANAAAFGGAIADDSYGVELFEYGPLVYNSIIWGNSAPEYAQPWAPPPGWGPIVDHSIMGECPTFALSCVIIPADPLLGPLQENGGYTRTLMPAPDSPAIDTGNDDVCPVWDQRGVPRPQGLYCDIGAVERQGVEDYIFNNGFDGI